MANKLTDKQKRFCEEFIIDLNATQAAIRTGYSEKTARSQGQRLLTNVDIMARIQELKAARSDRAAINADYVLNRLVEIDELDVIDIMLDDLSAFKPLSEWPKAWRTSISGIDMKRMILMEGDTPIDTVIEKIKWPDKTKNLDMIGKHVSVRAWEKEVELTTTVHHIMPVPTAESAENWEAAAKAQQEQALGEH